MKSYTSPIFPSIAPCTWHACGVIAQLYPESADELADFLIKTREQLRNWQRT